ncbi:3-oxoacyl-[acyl-carrier-protein] reductase [Salimicrobium jeotgali]|uniref:3-oxoacyl-[acyl-carrier-protein] reductase n=1 Tax=Salimicrobium jeotgali TaxID=1230341 RepID=K2GR12_9BACI|nr:3-oxoacyl-[acyl-carrier-protein] reductase [Salimicrobium jeotgali]AKG04607.1 3-oxoacyl-[acyl-carrier-protein] reductase [Salimicrobium jeotgali]EKE32824.1 3-oxoacyl-ACP reductase [Salimicrobium jeotgali]MBM7695187.1 3-oxoacyl-[acyl-carrier protein] reductase [Salimicrobium jeotgali]
MINGQTALVTGASRGIGRAIALELASHGAKVAVNYAGNEQKAQEVVEEIQSSGGEAIKIRADVSNGEDVQAMIKEVVDTFGSLELLVNNAGITKDNLLMRMKEEDFEAVIDTNLKGVFLTTKAVTRQMMRQKFGRIVNVSSIVGVSGNPGQANYVAAKSGVIGLTKSNAKELAAKNVRVNAVAPGYIATDMTDELTDEQKAQMLSLVPLNRLGSGEEVARVVRFLLDSDSDYMTGQTLHVDGGMVM